MTHNNERLQVKMRGRKGKLWDSADRTTASMTRFFSLFVVVALLFCFSFKFGFDLGEVARAVSGCEETG